MTWHDGETSNTRRTNNNHAPFANSMNKVAKCTAETYRTYIVLNLKHKNIFTHETEGKHVYIKALQNYRACTKQDINPDPDML